VLGCQSGALLKDGMRHGSDGFTFWADCRTHYGSEGEKHGKYSAQYNQSGIHSVPLPRLMREWCRRSMIRLGAVVPERRPAMSGFVDFAEVKERCSIVEAIALLGL